jgi:phosphate:Na+ symporter
MLRKILLPVIFAILAYGFWISPDVKDIAAGVAIFLFGMLFLEQGFKAFTGGTLENLLKRTTDKLWKSLSFGVITTTLMQSSSLVSVITISFLSAGLIGLSAGIGIIFGANLGTTTGAWLIAGFGLKVKISAFAMPMLVFGIILVFQSSKALKGAGYILAGLGFLFLGIHYMKEGFEAFKVTIDLSAYAIPGLRGLLIFALLGIIATVIMQSSHATLVLIITALAAGQITYENALALSIGANVGTTITAILGAMGSNVEGRRLAGAHLVFNLVTGIVAITFIDQFLATVNFFSEKAGIANDDYTLKLAVFHTLFNLAGIIIMLPFISPLVKLLELVLKPKKRKVSEPRYLNDSVLEMPDTAIEAIKKEIRHLFDNAFDVIAYALNYNPDTLRSDVSPDELNRLPDKVHKIDIDALYDRKIKFLYSEINAFISRVQTGTSAEQNEELYRLRMASRDIVESVKAVKHLQKNMVRYLASPNAEIRDQYRNIRSQLGTLMHEISRIEESEDPDLMMLSLDNLKVSMRRNDVLTTGVIDEKIRQRLITAEMATSLMNDNAYAINMADNLVEMAGVLFLPKESILRDQDRVISLNERDIETIFEDESTGTESAKVSGGVQ